MPRLNRFAVIGWCAVTFLGSASAICAQDEDTWGKVIDFERDVKPILEARCMECHSAVRPKDDLDFSSVDLVVDDNYVSAGDVDASYFFDRMVTDDEDELMPPVESGGRMPAHELAVVKLWIAEGADWPEEIILQDPARATTETTPPTPSTEEEAPAELSLFAKIWKFQGYFHYAVIHFPVALLSISALFVVLNWIFAGPFKDAAFYTLLFGALTSIPASTMGWALAPTMAYAGLGNEAVFWHRWLGVAVTVGSILISVLAIRSRKSDRARGIERLRGNLSWQVGVILLAMLVGYVGHEGGELVHGASFYDKAFSVFDSPEDDTKNEDAAAPADSNPDASGDAGDSDSDSGNTPDEDADADENGQGTNTDPPSDDDNGTSSDDDSNGDAGGDSDGGDSDGGDSDGGDSDNS